jgi:hypothetical protein
VIHSGGETAATGPLAELRRLRAVERHASAEMLKRAEATLAGHEAWVLEGRPGARSHKRHGGTARLLRIEWTPSGVASTRRYMNDRDGMRAVGTAIEGLADALPAARGVSPRCLSPASYWRVQGHVRGETRRDHRRAGRSPSGNVISLRQQLP